MGVAHATAATALVPQTMMSSGRDLRGGRDAMTARLAGLAPELRTYAEALRRERYPERAMTHELSARLGRTSYETGPASIAEIVGGVAYTFRTPRFAVGVSGGPLRFESGDTLVIGGLTPVEAHIVVGLGARDSLRLAVRGSSRPASLTAAQVSALASVGTAAADLSSIQFGTPASASARFVHVQPLGASLSIWMELAGDHEPRPGGAQATYWRGTTARAGVGLAGAAGQTRLSGAVLVTRSFADSLGGRNLFGGGGTVLARAHLATFISRPGDALVGVSASYFRPYSVGGSDDSRQRFPVRDFAGASALIAWPIGSLLLAPAAVVSHESSNASTGTGTVHGSGWSLRTSLALELPVAGSIAFTPEVGYTTGSVRLDALTAVGVTAAGVPITQSVRVTDALSGWWLAAGWSAVF